MMWFRLIKLKYNFTHIDSNFTKLEGNENIKEQYIAMVDEIRLIG